MLGHASSAGRERHRELIAAEPRRSVSSAPQQPAEAWPDVPQDLVAGVVAERLVELLEAVEIDQQQRDLRPAAVRVVIAALSDRAGVGGR